MRRMLIVYGGSFNPPTNAHYEIAHYLIKKYNPSHFIFAPVGNPYGKKNLVRFKHRYNMLKLICDQLEYASITDYENNESYEGTVSLLQHLETQYEELPYFVLGTDNVFTLDKWINYELLLKRYRFIVIIRGNADVDAFLKQHSVLKHYQANFIIESDFPHLEVSSSLYREGGHEEMISKEVNDYIKKNKLYNRGT